MSQRCFFTCLLPAAISCPNRYMLVYQVSSGTQHTWHSCSMNVQTCRYHWIQDESLLAHDSHKQALPIGCGRTACNGADRPQKCRGCLFVQENFWQAARDTVKHSEPNREWPQYSVKHQHWQISSPTDSTPCSFLRKALYWWDAHLPVSSA